MGKVNLKNSEALSNLSHSICDIKNDMQDNLIMLNKVFSVACENWQDKNAQTCSDALDTHNLAMNDALFSLGDFENKIKRLSQLASKYEDI